MKLDKLTLKDALEETLSNPQREGQLCPSDAEILAYHEGRMAVSEQPHFQKRLALYPTALERLLRLEKNEKDDLFGTDEGQAVISQSDEDAAWQALSERIAAQATSPAPREVSAVAPKFGSWTQGLLLVACLILSLMVVQLNDDLRGLQAPSTDVVMTRIDLSVRSALFLDWEKGQPYALEFLLDGTSQNYLAYQIEIQKVDGALYYSTKVEGPSETVSLFLPADSFSELQQFRVIIYGIKNGERIECGFKDFKARS